MYCLLYNNDSVKICQAEAFTSAFTLATDSLTKLYGPASDTIVTAWEKTQGSSNHVTVFRNRLEQEGYYCDCAK